MTHIKIDRYFGEWVAYSQSQILKHYGHGKSIPEALEDCIKRNGIDTYTWK